MKPKEIIGNKLIQIINGQLKLVSRKNQISKETLVVIK